MDETETAYAHTVFDACEQATQYFAEILMYKENILMYKVKRFVTDSQTKLKVTNC